MAAGSHARLRNIIRFISDSASEKTMAKYHRRVGLLTRRHLQEGFDRGTDPYGRRWPPSKKSGSPTMMRSGALRRGIRYRSSAQQVVVWEQARNAKGLRYGPVLHRGATIRPKRSRSLSFELNGRSIFAKKVIIPPRPFMLEEGRPLPRELADEIEDGVWADIRGEWTLI